MSIFSTRLMILFFFLSLQNTSASGGINVTTTPIYTLCGNQIQAVNEQFSIAFEIEDTGPDISEEDRSKLFQAYLQNGGGHGLGLWISQLIINAHGSQIEILPAYHGGSIFRFSLQAAEPRASVYQQEEYRQVPNPLTIHKSETSISI